jgi:hypothetical protein
MFPALISSGSAAHGHSPRKDCVPGRDGGPGPKTASGGSTGSSMASNGSRKPGWNHTPPGRFIAPVRIISTQVSQAVTLPFSAPMVTPVPVWTATGPARRTAASRSCRSAAASPATSAA